MDKKWVIKEKEDVVITEQLAKSLDIENKIASLLVQRNIHTPDDASSFFKPDLSGLHDPFLMMDMNKAVDRISSAIDRNEKILVYGDYDVDGTTSVALVYSFFKKIYSNLGFYIPDRHEEGYGISYKGIDWAVENNYSLIIALDCGIKAIEKIDYATGKGVEFIICDHHMPDKKIPDATAILDPKRADCNYPFKELSGCGVGFKLLQAYSKINNIPFSELIPYLDLVAVSIASDIVPVTGENRILAYYGLKQLNANPGTGLKAIIKVANMNGRQIRIGDIVFKIGPRINAAGRMESGKKAVELLTTEDSGFAYEMSRKINDFNNERRKIDQDITQQALQMISSDPKLENSKSTVVFDPGWHKGVIGIVASRLTETYYRPTVVLTESNGLATGSARSVLGFDLYKAINSCSDLLENFGGHMYAAGLTMKKENIPLFRKRFEEFVSNTIRDDQLDPCIEVDMELGLEDISEKLYNILDQFQPFGPGNMQPLFVSRDVSDSGYGKAVGSTGEHLKLELIKKDESVKAIPAIAFSLSNHLSHIKEGKPFDVCYSIEMNEFRGVSTLQMNIKDIKEK
ncbi:MAG: single-stranded-DNA-specific exonuclease RecJ [Bacteroidetes bacterium]|nr:single-stranded-DNA-specific exonuclease RecJ [Bacteroidota bacterium]